MSTSDNPSLGEDGYSQPDPTPEGRARRVFSRLGQSPATFAPSFEFVAAEFRVAVEAEREACAKLCDESSRLSREAANKHDHDDFRCRVASSRAHAAHMLAEKIRARGKES